MIVQRKKNREIWVNAVVNGLPDVVIAGIVILIFDGGFLLFIGVLFGLQVVYLAVWLKNSIWLWVRYAVKDKKLIAGRLLDFLIENKFPKPDQLVDSAEEYLQGVTGCRDRRTHHPGKERLYLLYSKKKGG